MESTSTGFLVNAKGTTTSTPLSAAFRNISNYFFSSSAANRIPVAQNNVATTGISRVITIGRTTTDDAILSGSVSQLNFHLEQMLIKLLLTNLNNLFPVPYR